jgi:hypothetical protein
MFTMRFAEAVQLLDEEVPTVIVTLEEKLPELSQPLTVILCVPALMLND